jgi:deoxyribose-phosphate aldolase
MQKMPNLNEYLDHTYLKPEAGESDILKICEEANKYHLKGVCVDKKWLGLLKKKLNPKTLKVTVISFPSGDNSISEKVNEAKQAIELGADEVDMVIQRKYIQNQDYFNALKEISEVVRITKDKPLKLILETSELSPTEITILCALAKIGGAQFVKTSTGFSKAGATTTNVKLMRQIVGENFGVKASGGVKTYEQAIEMIESGATRIGTSSSVQILTQQGVSTDGY